MASTIAANMLQISQTMPRANAGFGIPVIAVDGDWNSRIAGSVGSSASTTAVLIALDEGRSESCMAWTLAFHVAVLLCPELAIDRATFQQHAMRRDIHQPALLQHQR